jgi:ATP-dependent Zn protease
MKSLPDGFEEQMKKLLKKQEKNEQKRLMKYMDKKRVAYHEAGHAMIAHYFGRKLGDITIIPDPDALGRVKDTPNEPSDKISPENLKDQILARLKISSAVLLGGLVAEHIYDGEKRSLNPRPL